MKKTYAWLALSILMMGAGLFNLTMDIDSRGHYFGNGVVFGVGLAVLVVQINKLRKTNKS